FNNEAVWCVAYEIKRIAGDQGDAGDGPGLEDAHILRVHDLHAANDVIVFFTGDFDLDQIAGSNVFKYTEESVTMSGDRQITVPARGTCADDSSQPTI